MDVITPFNRVKLFVDSSSEAAANVTARLKAEDIPYDMRTRQSIGATGKSAAGGKYMTGMAASRVFDQVAYIYTIYVRRKDEDRAREACNLPPR